MEWQKQLQKKFETNQIAQISIDGYIYTLESAGDHIQVIDPYQDEQQYPSLDAVIHHFESNLENPTIAIIQ